MTTHSHVAHVFITHPIQDDRDRVFDEVGVAEDMLDFMRELYAVHPELKDRCAGERNGRLGIPLCPCSHAEQLIA